jgi:hypothetical protein
MGPPESKLIKNKKQSRSLNLLSLARNTLQTTRGAHAGSPAQGDSESEYFFDDGEGP